MGMTVYRDISTCFEELSKSPWLAVDLETTGLSPYRDQIAVISISGITGATLVQHVLYTGIPQELRSLLVLPKQWITHNGTCFDLLLLEEVGITCRGTHYDTLIGELVLSVQGRKDISKKLGPTMKRRIGQDYKQEIDHASWRRATLTAEQVEYCAHDIFWLHAIMEKQQTLANERNLRMALDKEQELSLVTFRMMHNGIPVNTEVLEAKRAQLIREAAEAKTRVDEIIGAKVNLNSNPQLTKRLKELGHPVPNIQAGTLIRKGRTFPICRDIVTVKKAAKRDEFYDDEWAAKFIINGRVHPQFWQLGANTTRYTSQFPNAQQFPRNMRTIVGNEEGMVVISGDYSQIEVRVAAFYSQDEELMQACFEDIHTSMATAMWHLREAPSKELRNRGKHGTFRLIFGGGAGGIVDDSEEAEEEDVELITLEEAKEMRANFLTRFHVYRDYIQDAAKKMNRGGIRTLVLPWGHQRQYLPGQGKVTTYLNNQMQGTAAIIMKEGLLEMARRGLLKYLCMQVHDEAVAASVPKAEAEDYAHEMEESLLVGARLTYETIKAHSKKEYKDIPTEVEVKIGEAWS